MSIQLPFRQIHLDFHTGPAIPDVGRDFDADEFADILADARVNSVTLFAKCHHGHLYYDTQHPARHPSLPKGLDLLGRQIDALHRRNIQAPIYLSVQCDEYAANTYPQWLVRDHEGKPPAGPFKAGWHIVDMSSPYQDFLAEQIEEVVRKYRPVDGVFLDMCWDQPSSSPWAIDAMTKAGLHPEDEGDRKRFANHVVHQYMTRYNKVIAAANGKKMPKVWYNSRPKIHLPDEKRYLQHIEIEALPTGGWGYTYFPLNVRFARNFGLPSIGMTARFHKSWADFGGLKPQAALMYECCQMLAHGCGCSVGDQLHPRGTLDRASYQMIGHVYRHVEACEPWCRDAAPLTQIGVLRNLDPAAYRIAPGDALEGVVRSLQQLHHQFDFIHIGSTFNNYDLIIVPETMPVTADLKKKLQAFHKAGGALLVVGDAAVDSDGKPILKDLGITAHGPSPFTTTYLRFDKAIAAGVPATDHVLYERGLRITPAAAPGTTTLCRIVEPYFERTWDHFCSHNQTPGDKLSKYAAAVQKGNCITIAFPIFKAYATHGNLSYRQLLGACLDRLLPQPLTRWQGPSHVEVTVTRQSSPRPRTIVHLLSYIPARRTPKLDLVEEPTPFLDATLSLKLTRAPKRVTRQPTGETLPFTYTDGYATVTLTSHRGHDMLIFDPRK